MGQEPAAGFLQGFGYFAGAEIGLRIAAQGVQDEGGLDGVDGAAAAEADDKLRMVLLEFPVDAKDILTRGVRLGAPDVGFQFHAGILQGLPDCRQVWFDAGEAGRNEKGVFPGLGGDGAGLG
ncbi:MAG: hypothetical protein BWY71_01926 [Planctomycetes bacterium ADurb.Bin412]|nr:MAG: hypothetical protein BWY71_01926 [Planctomycetes bacterium ADurb.Bin412]